MITQIQEAIRNSGLSVNQLSKKCDVSQSLLSRFLSGERGLSLETAIKICDALGLRLVGPKKSARPAPAEKPKRPGRPRKAKGE